MKDTIPVTRVAVLIGILLGAALVAPARPIERSFERTIRGTQPVTLDADTHSGGIDVRIGAEGTVVVRGTVKRNVSWRGAQVTDAQIESLRTSPPVRADLSSVRIEPISDEKLRQSVSIDYVILVPASTRIQVAANSGSVQIAGSRESVRAVTESGAIRVQAASGTVDLQSGSGAVRVAGTMHSLAMRTQSGSILAEADSVEAVEVSSGSGSITVSGVRGTVRAESGSSRITIDGTPTGDWDVRSRSGSVAIRVPEGSRFNLVAKSRSGNVKATFPVASTIASSKHAVEGTVNGGGPTLVVETGSSSITVKP
jgi:DUF4097 and DUF4098 domain-containing protein YvlB